MQRTTSKKTLHIDHSKKHFDFKVKMYFIDLGPVVQSTQKIFDDSVDNCRLSSFIQWITVGFMVFCCFLLSTL